MLTINEKIDILIGNTPLKTETTEPIGSYVDLQGETYIRIANYDQMPSFFMNLVSGANHWLFIASTGGLTAGRTNSDHALFPYETEDKIAAHSDETGSKSIIRATQNGRTFLWEPFSDRYAGVYRCERHLYKNIYGNKLIFEEINHDLRLTLRTAWLMGDRFGFIKSCSLQNDGDEDCHVELLDGLQNILPHGATRALQNSYSNLLNAYKRNELDSRHGLGIFALSATLSDRAEPSESLKASVAWQVGLEVSNYLLCSEQLDAFREGHPIKPEHDVLGKAGAFFVNAAFELAPGASQKWRIVADVNQDSAAISRLNQLLGMAAPATLDEQIEQDIAQVTQKLVAFVAAADGLQLTAERTITAHHFANVLFNVMRGGIFGSGYQIDRRDLLDFIAVRNRPVLAAHADWFADLPAQMSIQALYSRAAERGASDLIRLCYEYLPLSFSRRHGDPSRPWNSFSINLKQPDGSPQLDYQGNWRDIFQNWEPLAYSFPTFIEGIIAKFLNATTVDGYNPYRVTRDGIEWEVLEPDNPWSNIGYWSDHQIIYLQKLLEIAENVHPNSLSTLWNLPIFANANVPYRLRTYSEMLADWDSTIDYDWDLEHDIETSMAQMGTDGRLHLDAVGSVIHVTMTEKLLVLLLAKLTNLVPEGGIWMNTQRPEWNDANNALVGKGLSVVTVAYLRRFISFWLEQLTKSKTDRFGVNADVAALLSEVRTTFTKYQRHLENGFSDQARRAVMDDLGRAATVYRTAAYEGGGPATMIELTLQEIVDFLDVAQSFIEHTLQANRRADGLFHSYNILAINDQAAAVEHLYLMLEGQVALLSSGFLTSAEALSLLRSLRQSDLYRADLHTYMLYPNRTLPSFQEKNNVSSDQVTDSALVAALAEAGDRRLLIRDIAGVFHFNGDFRNADDVIRTLDSLADEPAYAELAAAERSFILDLFESTFDHRAFTGRSGTFFAYEGLGSVYWHMVSKLLLAAQECYQQAVDSKADKAVIEALAQAYYDVRQGLGFNKSPAEYGAFPTDPYSHSPIGEGARQPGMTGQVKEEILTRMGELGLFLRQGKLCFAPTLLRDGEFLSETSTFSYVDSSGRQKSLTLPAGSLAFTICQTPVVYAFGKKASINVRYQNGAAATVTGNCLDVAMTQPILDRDGQVEMVQVTLEK